MYAEQQITLNVDDFLSESEKKQIVSDAFRAEASRKSAEDFERIIGNSAYHLVSAAVDAHFDGKMVEVLKANTIKVIENLSTHTVFSPPNAWDRAASKGFEHLQTSLDELKPAIQARVEELISSYDSGYLSVMIERQVGEAILRKLTA